MHTKINSLPNREYQTEHTKTKSVFLDDDDDDEQNNHTNKTSKET